MSLKKETLGPLVEEYGAGILKVSVNDIIGHIEAKHGPLSSELKRKVDKFAKSYSKKKFKEAEKALVKPKPAPLRVAPVATPARAAPVVLPTHIRFGSPSPGTTRKHTKFADGPTKINVHSPTIKSPDRKFFGPTGNVRTLFADRPTKINTTNLFGESPLLAEKKRSKSKRKV
jgi:hypothetical protein